MPPLTPESLTDRELLAAAVTDLRYEIRWLTVGAFPHNQAPPSHALRNERSFLPPSSTWSESAVLAMLAALTEDGLLALYRLGGRKALRGVAFDWVLQHRHTLPNGGRSCHRLPYLKALRDLHPSER